MKPKIGIIGAGSIGNHLGYSFSNYNWEVHVLDIDIKAVDRFKKEIFPSRYGRTPSEFFFYTNYDEFLKESFELVIIGTPPDSHTEIFSQISKYYQGDIMIEKPMCTPKKGDLERFIRQAGNYEGHVFVGYNHRVSRATQLALHLISESDLGPLNAIEVNWRESWDGILKAHPWLASPGDTYLGHSVRGGGALFEHSHGIDLAVFMSEIYDGSQISLISSQAEVVERDGMKFDKSVEVVAQTATGVKIRVHQDVETQPAEKSLKMNFANGVCTLNYGIENQKDKVTISVKDINYFVEILKSRPDDFNQEVKSITDFRSGKIPYDRHPLRLSSAIKSTQLALDAYLWASI